MGELERILKFAEERVGHALVLATIVDVKGSHYRRVGAQVAFDSAGCFAGAQGGNCLDDDLRLRAQSVFQTGEPQLVDYDLDSECDVIWGLGMGCGGRVSILLERLDNSARLETFAALTTCIKARTTVIQATVFKSTDLLFAKPGDRAIVTSESPLLSNINEYEINKAVVAQAKEALQRQSTSVAQIAIHGVTVEALIECILPPVSLIIIGAGEDAIPLAKYATELGWEITLVDHRKELLNQRRFPGVTRMLHCPVSELSAHLIPDERSAAVILTHNFHADQYHLRTLLPSKASYIGLLGARSRTRSLVAQLISETPELEGSLAKLFSPVGLDIGADSPAAIALSITAEIHAFFSGRRGNSLRDDHSLTVARSMDVLDHA